jgi:hypothetical protein
MRVSTCWNCGQVATDDTRDDERHLFIETHGYLCEPCKSKLYEPQGEPMRLFAPAPNQIPGQMSL